MPELPSPEAPRIILKSHEDYRRARERLGALQGAAPQSPCGLELESLTAALAAYEGRDKGPGARS